MSTEHDQVTDYTNELIVYEHTFPLRKAQHLKRLLFIYRLGMYFKWLEKRLKLSQSYYPTAIGVTASRYPSWTNQSRSCRRSAVFMHNNVRGGRVDKLHTVPRGAIYARCMSIKCHNQLPRRLASLPSVVRWIARLRGN